MTFDKRGYAARSGVKCFARRHSLRLFGDMADSLFAVVLSIEINFGDPLGCEVDGISAVESNSLSNPPASRSGSERSLVRPTDISANLRHPKVVVSSIGRDPSVTKPKDLLLRHWANRKRVRNCHSRILLQLLTSTSSDRNIATITPNKLGQGVSWAVHCGRRP